MTNNRHTVLYIGVTNDLKRRVYEHKMHLNAGFTSKYACDEVVYYEVCDSIDQAILREKQLKSGPRQKKVELIISNNPEWNDLYDQL